MRKERLFLFDIDGTILSTNKSGYYSYLEAYAQTFFGGRSDEVAFNVDFAGKTDRIIFNDLMVKNGFADSGDEDWARFLSAYVKLLAEKSKDTSRWRIYEGVRELIDYLAPRAYLGLLTGNVAEGAKLKLSPIGLLRHFPTGAFADDGIERNELAEIALENAAMYYQIDFSPDEVWVIGDTPHDIACGKHIGANTIAVATGSYSLEELQAHMPDIAVHTLADIELDSLIS